MVTALVSVVVGSSITLARAPVSRLTLCEVTSTKAPSSVNTVQVIFAESTCVPSATQLNIGGWDPLRKVSGPVRRTAGTTAGSKND